ncbi:MAG: hypothetical protein KC422_17690 [Trueperaceae bacterium]|nr:hypothetical protein [Trueperaceae bacterium]
MSLKQTIENALDQGKGVLRLAPTWVPRTFCIPGKRIKLHPDDYYILGLNRGGIDERWLSSTIRAQNGPLTAENEGLSQVVFEHAGKTEKVLLQAAVAEFKDEIIGKRLWDAYKRWPMYSKFFDNKGPLPFHIHHDDAHAALVGQFGKPEMYFFPKQMNNHGGTFPFTFFGLNPSTSKEQLKACLAQFEKGDNKILDLSKAHNLTLGTGWDVPPGVLHAPGSLCTYEPQFASDIYAMYQSVLYGGETVSADLLWANTPEDKLGNLDYLVEVVNWELNVDPMFYENRFMPPVAIESASEAYSESWICYKSKSASAKELTVKPGQKASIKDNAAYGFIAVQGHGTINGRPLETPTLIRYGELTYDEYFVTEAAARTGVVIENQSYAEPLVLLKHFGPDNPDLGMSF